MIYLGLDPGLSGSIVWINSQATVCYTKRFKDITDKELSILMGEIRAMNKNCVAILERVHAFPGMGVSTVWKFAQNYGMLQGLLMAHNIPFKLVTPQVWMGWYGMKKDKGESKVAWKRRLRQKAQELFPTVDVKAETADAILIAEYARKNY